MRRPQGGNVTAGAMKQRWCSAHQNTHYTPTVMDNELNGSSEMETLKGLIYSDKLTHPPAVQQHPSSPGIGAFWEAAERRTARDTSRGSPSGMLTSPWRQVNGDRPDIWQVYEDGTEERGAGRCRSSSIGWTSLLTRGAEVRRCYSDRISPPGGDKPPATCSQWPYHLSIRRRYNKVIYDLHIRLGLFYLLIFLLTFYQ